ncbi:MAG: sigma-70 family RNA polymerase sigma factor [Myxococcota bacterium]|nr:sigma-70 family RNA polymerase sigma factor [Myxococcota bacterium]
MADAPAVASEGGAARAVPPGLAEAFEGERGHLFGLLYRLTGSAADAEDLVQSTFERALERPPKDTGRPWKPWLVRVAVNLGRDHLRRRRRRRYDGPWLPAPLDTPEGSPLLEARPASGFEPDAPPSYEPPSTEGRYELLESVSYAFLLALEELTPTQRAVLLLREVFEYSGKETAFVLGLSEVGVRQHLRRARRAMASYDEDRRAELPDEDVMQQTLARFLAALASGDPKQVESMLAEDVTLQTDAGGEFHAARVLVTGRKRVARFHINVTRLSGPPNIALRSVNGTVAVVGESSDPKPGIAPRFVTHGLLDDAGRIRRIWTVLATHKLRGVKPLPAEGASSR